MKEVMNQSLLNFELGSQKGMKVFVWIIIVSQQTYRQNSQNVNKNTFCRLPVTSTHCNFGTEKYPDAGILLNYDDNDDDYSQS